MAEPNEAAERAALYQSIGYKPAAPASAPAPNEQAERAALYGELNSLTPQAKLEKARATAQNFQGFQGAEKFAEHLPGIGLGKDIGRRIKYRRAQAAIDKGTATDDDYLYVAHMERLDQLQGEGTLGQKVGRSLLKVPAMAMEFAAGGPLIRGGTALGARGGAALGVRAGATAGKVGGTVGGALGTGVASSPLMGAVQGAQDRARLSNTDPTELKNAAPAVGLATLHGAVIGRLQQKMGGSKSLKQLLVKAPAAGAVGVAEKQAADTVGGLIDQMLPENVRMGEKFGLFGKVRRGLKGEPGELDAAAESAIIDFTTFTAFAGIHGGPLAVKKVRNAFQSKLEEGQKAGTPVEQTVPEAIEAAKNALPKSRDLASVFDAQGNFRPERMGAEPPRPESEQQIPASGEKAPAEITPTTPASPTGAHIDPGTGKIVITPRLPEGVPNHRRAGDLPKSPNTAPKQPEAPVEREIDPEIKYQLEEASREVNELRATAAQFREFLDAPPAATRTVHTRVNGKDMGAREVPNTPEDIAAARERAQRNLTKLEGKIAEAEAKLNEWESKKSWVWNKATKKFEPPPEITPTTPAEPTKAPTAVEPTRPPESPAEAKPELSTGSDRRVDPQRRKLLSEMTAEEARKELVTSRLEDESGGFIELPIPNARGYQEAELASPSKAKAFSDSDGLKALNDTFGYSAGNAMLAAKARVLKELGIDAYHQKGDEFIYRAENEAELRAKLDQARAKLQETEFEVTGKDGSVRKFKGADFSFGVAGDLKAAAEGMKAHKKEREAKGERGPRAQLGRIVEVGQGREVPAGGPGAGSPEARPEAAPEGKGQTLLDKMRARQQGQTATAKPQYPEPTKEAPVNVEAEFDRAGLVGTERYALSAALRGQSLRDIAADPKFTKLYGRETNQQTVANILERAGKKLGAPDIRAKVEEVLASERADRAAELVEQGGRAAEDLLGDGDAVRGVEKKADAWDKATADIEAIAEQMVKEAESGRLTPERRAELEAQALAARRAATGGEPGEKPKAPGVARKVEGKAPGTAPKQPEPQRAAEPAADAGLAAELKATIARTRDPAAVSQTEVNALIDKVAALQADTTGAKEPPPPPFESRGRAGDAGVPLYSGFPIPMEWVNAMTRWVLGSPRGKDPAFQPDADPNPNNQRAVPPWQIAKEAAATQLGARIHTDAEKATTAYAWSKHVGEQVANEWQIAHSKLDAAFPVENGTIPLANGQRGYMADVVTAEMQRPGSQPLTPEQRQAVDIWKGVLEKQLKAMESAGLKKFYDDQGNRLSVSDLLQRGYLPQLVKPKTALGQAWNAIFGRTATTAGGKPGTKPGFRKRRVHQTEEEGVKAGTEYVASFSTRVAEFIKQSNREIADHHLANDPLLAGKDLVKPFFRRLLAERKHLKSALTKQEWNDEVRRLRGLATQAATGNVFVAPAFKGKEYSPEVKAQLEMMYGDRGGRYLKFAQAASQELRNLVLGPDVSYATLQLQGMLFSNPVRWARTMARAGEAFFKGDTIQRLAQEDPGIREAMQEITQAGGSIGTRPEMIATLGGGKSLAERIPGYERFGKAFSTAIDLAKIELWRANKPADPSQWPRAIEAIENSLGSGRMEQLGMSPERAFLERLFFLAPSYYRGYTKLLQQGFDRGAGGAIARKQLGFMASGVLLTGVAGLYAAFSAGLISEDELYERLDPSRGKFLMVPVTVSDDKRIEVGMGGFYVSMVRTLANMAEKKSVFGPLGRWYRGHSGMIPRLTADVGSGRDYFGNPISTEEAVAKSVLPIAAQDVVMGDGAPEQRAAQAGAGMVGGRAFPPSEKGEYVDALRRFAQGKTGQNYSDLGLRERAKLVREFNRTHKPPTVAPENRQVAQERAAAAQAERQKKLMAGVKTETRKRLEEFGKVLPSYDVDLAYGGVQIPMTPGERREYEKLLIEEYDREIAKWPVDRLRRLNEKSRADYMRRQLESAKERAKRRLMSPAVAR